MNDKTTSPPKKQTPPRMGSALRYYLKRYAADLVLHAQTGDRVASSLIDCCNSLLIESDRLESGQL